jgi:hypothetical protein
MSIKDDIIALINKAYRTDEYTNDFTGAVTSVMNAIIQFCNSVHDNIFFDTLDIEGVEWWENLLAIVPASYQTIADRRSKIRAKWLSKYHNDVELLQRVCNSWKNGEIQVGFVGGKITLNFISSYGIPSDLDALKVSIEEVKPAHIPLVYVIKYLLKKEIHHILTKSEMQTYKKHQYCNVGIGV